MPSPRMLVLLSWLLLGAAAQYDAMQAAAGLSPRYYLGTSPDLLKRQSGLCGADEHSCNFLSLLLSYPLIPNLTGMN